MFSTDSKPGSSTEERNAIRALAPLFFFFLSSGVVTVMLGPLLPAFIRQWQIADAQAGTLFLVNFAGQLCGSWIAARNLKASIVYGPALTAAGCATLASLSFGLAHIAVFAIGLGLGAGLTAGNVIAGTSLPSSRGRLLAALNVAWSIGAIACPLLIRFTASSGIERFFYVAAGCLAISALLCLAIPSSAFSPYPYENATPSHPRASRVGSSPLPLSTLPLLLFSAAMFLYIGIENSLGGWLPSYAIRTRPSLPASSLALFFWTAELAGRLLVVALLGVFTESVLYRIALAALCCTEVMLCIIAHPSAQSLVLLTTLAALSLAPLYPLLLSFLLARTGNHARLGIFFVAASCGGATLPWLTGVLSTRFQGLRAGLIVPTISALLLLAISPVLIVKSTAGVKRHS